MQFDLDTCFQTSNRKSNFYNSLINYNTGTSGTRVCIVYICGLHVSTYTQGIFRPSCTRGLPRIAFYGLTCRGGPEDDLCIG